MLRSRLSILSLLLLYLGLFSTSVLGGREECGTVVTDDDISAMERDVAAVNFKRQTGSIRNYTFGVYFNIVAANMTTDGGWMPQKQIDDQMDLLNRRYVGTGISFTLLSVTRILSRRWHEIIDGDVKETNYMYRLFHKGGSVHLNVYTVGFYGAGLNGYARLPVSYATRPHQDGVVLQYATVPGGTSRERQGSTLVHEVGHWLGLRHTFQGGCVGVGDGVDDTPPEAEPASGCPIGRKSCPNSDLPDPIHNFMDYSDETCRIEFTPGQADLMQRSILAYRNNPNF